MEGFDEDRQQDIALNFNAISIATLMQLCNNIVFCLTSLIFYFLF